MKRYSSPTTLFFILSISLALIPGCDNKRNQSKSEPASNSTSQIVSQPSVTPVVDIPRLAGKSAVELDRALGKPAAITKITSHPEMMPGEFRDYRVDGTSGVATQYGLMVRFHRGRAVQFTLDLPRFIDTPAEALLLAGIDVRGAAPRVKASGAHRWTGKFGGVDFKDAAAVKASIKDDQKYTTVQAEMAN